MAKKFKDFIVWWSTN